MDESNKFRNASREQLKQAITDMNKELVFIESEIVAFVVNKDYEAANCALAQYDDIKAVKDFVFNMIYGEVVSALQK